MANDNDLDDIVQTIKNSLNNISTNAKQNIFSKILDFKISVRFISKLLLIFLIAMYSWKFYNAVECKVNLDFQLPKLPSIPKLDISNLIPETKIKVQVFQIKLISADDTKVVLKIGENSEETRTDGSASWRYNNPGLIFYGDFAKSVGAIGTDGKYAIFASYDDGRKAQENLLFESKQGYKDKTLNDALKLYAPKNEGFNTDYYVETVKKQTGISFDKILSSFTSEERKSLLDTLEQIERFKQGKVEVK